MLAVDNVAVPLQKGILPDEVQDMMGNPAASNRQEEQRAMVEAMEQEPTIASVMPALERLLAVMPPPMVASVTSSYFSAGTNTNS